MPGRAYSGRRRATGTTTHRRGAETPAPSASASRSGKIRGRGSLESLHVDECAIVAEGQKAIKIGIAAFDADLKSATGAVAAILGKLDARLFEDGFDRFKIRHAPTLRIVRRGRW